MVVRFLTTVIVRREVFVEHNQTQDLLTVPMRTQNYYIYIQSLLV